MASFWCDNNILRKEDFKNTRTNQNIRGQQVVKSTLSYLEKLNQTDT